MKKTSSGADDFSITNATRGALPRIAFSNMKEAIMGKGYSLSLVFIGDQRMRTLNRTSRGKDATTDILSFPLSKASGEIFISLQEASKRSKKFGLPPTKYLTFLFIHGLLHLKGHDHGRTMEQLEKRWCKQFNISLPEN